MLRGRSLLFPPAFFGFGYARFEYGYGLVIYLYILLYILTVPIEGCIELLSGDTVAHTYRLHESLFYGVLTKRRAVGIHHGFACVEVGHDFSHLAF